MNEGPAQGRWRVKKTHKCCCGCAAEFEPGQLFFSALQQKDAEFQRLDFCRPCWENGNQNRFFSFWQTRLKTEQKPPPLREDVIFGFFHKLKDNPAPEAKSFRFVLALLLWRKKLLKLKETRQQDDLKVLVFQEPGNERNITVVNPGLREEQIQRTSEKLGQILQMDIY